MSSSAARPRSAGVPTDDATEKIKRIYRKYDVDGNGQLAFDEFFAILKMLESSWSEANALKLFQTADQDLSGYMEFDEFVDYLNGDCGMDKLFRLEDEAGEEEAKEALLLKPHALRAKASKLLKEKGERWGKLTWKRRLQEVMDLEKSISEGSETRVHQSPSKSTSSSYKVKSKVHANGNVKPKITEIKPTRSVSATAPSRLRAEKFGIAAMSQKDIVDYSITNDDLGFTCWDAEAMAFREHLKTAPGPSEHINVLSFIAKGTAGFVFLAEDKESGGKVAMKLIRMTQARTGVREWYISKKLGEAGVENVVLTFESVFVLDRDKCPPVVDAQLQNAGPVPFYMCMVQECMPWGTLENLANEGELSPGIMFLALYNVSSTLAAMHANKVQHKDVKPENIMLQMEDDVIVAAKLCDLGSAEVGENPRGCADDVRRFGVTMFSVATGEGWTKNKLIRESHENLVARLRDSVADSTDPNMKMLPDILNEILQGGGTGISMREVADIMKELSESY